MVEPVGLTKKFRGLNPQEVDQYLEKLKQSQEEEIRSLEKQLENIREEKNLLYKKVYELQEKWANKSEEKDLLDLALLRTKNIAELLLQKAINEVKELLDEAEKKNADNKKKTSNIEEEIALIQTQIQSMLESLNSVFKETENEKTSQLSNKIIHFNDIMHEKKTKDNEKENIEENVWQEEQPITADGTRVSDLTKNSNVKENNQQFKKMMEKLAKVLNNQEEKKDTEEDLKNPNVDNEAVSNQSENNFWAEQDHKAEKEIASTVKENEEPENSEATSIQVIETPSISNEEISQVHDEDKKVEIKEEIQRGIDNLEKQEQNVLKDKDNATKRGNIAGSPAISAEINNIRFKYIAGKIAGQDLYDSSGKLIIAKGKVITSEIVATVETEGKLPELIVNMVLPGMEE